MTVAGGVPVHGARRDPAGGAHETELVRDLARLEALGDELDEVHARTGAPASARWAAVHADMRHEPRAKPWCVVVRRGPAIVAAGLAVAQWRLGGCSIRSATHPHEPGWLAALDDPASDALASAIAGSLTALRRPWRLEWRHLPVADPTLAALLGLLPVSASVAGGSAARVVR
ncbi:MAG: hypothetical protein ACJ8IK_25560, partial [Burkholderiaceae bacterium]